MPNNRGHKDLVMCIVGTWQALAGTCRNMLLRIETEATYPAARQAKAPHAEALQAALDALLTPVPEPPPNRSERPWEL